MDQSKFLSLIKQVVREELRSVIKEQLSEILQEGLQSTIAEMNTNLVTEQVKLNKSTPPANSRQRKAKVEFAKNKFSDILNGTDKLQEDMPLSMNSYADLMSENITMTSADAMNFGAQRKALNLMPMHPSMAVPTTITDPETGRELSVDPTIAKAMTRDYSALLKAMDKKKIN
jgi:hypothetical protein